MTARIATCHELTKNEVDLKKVRELFLTCQTSATPASLLLPWFPSPARKTGKCATSELYTLLHGYVETRRCAPELQSDAFDVLIVMTSQRSLKPLQNDIIVSCHVRL